MNRVKHGIRSTLRGGWRRLTGLGRRIDRWLESLPGEHLHGDESEAHRWFHQHYGWAADEIGSFLEDAGVRLEGTRVADIGSGDGIIDLGLLHRWKPGRLTGFDVKPTSPDLLAEAASLAGVTFEASPALVFEASAPTQLPAPDDAFDISWSAFEHVADPGALLAEVRRVLRPGGWFFCQIRPLFPSQHGSHLERWFPEGWVHLVQTPGEIHAAMCALDPDGTDVERMWMEFQALNRVTLDEFGEHLAGAGLEVVCLELEAGRVELPASLAQSVPLSSLVIDGFRLLAR